jgi:hypothetical protein
MPRNKTGDQNSSARLVAVSESGNHLVSFSNSIVFTTSFALTDHYGKPNFTKKTGPKIEQVLAQECGPETLFASSVTKKTQPAPRHVLSPLFLDGLIVFACDRNDQMCGNGLPIATVWAHDDDGSRPCCFSVCLGYDFYPAATLAAPQGHASNHDAQWVLVICFA